MDAKFPAISRLTMPCRRLQIRTAQVLELVALDCDAVGPEPQDRFLDEEHELAVSCSWISDPPARWRPADFSGHASAFRMHRTAPDDAVAPWFPGWRHPVLVPGCSWAYPARAGGPWLCSTLVLSSVLAAHGTHRTLSWQY